MNTPDVKSSGQRLVSVDALRGFDMFWIIGADALVQALNRMSETPVTRFLASQMDHAEWEGFRFYDLIFPLFLFIVGVSLVLSMDRMLATHGRKGAFLRITRRSVLLLVLGIFYYGGVSRAWPDVQFSGVLPRIALCYFFAATLYVLLPRKGILAAAALCLAAYWALLMFVPFPDVCLKHEKIGKKETQAQAAAPAVLFAGADKTVSGTFEEGRNLTHYVDARWLPGKKRNLYYSNEGLLSTLPAVASTLLGVMAGWLLTSSCWSSRQKVAWLLAAGAAGVALGFLWGLEFPVIKRLWTSSYVLVAGGYSAMLLGVFYLVVDVWQVRAWCLPFVWMGTNAITIYLADNILGGFSGLAARLVGGDVQQFADAHISQGCGDLLIALVGLLLAFLFVRFLYQRKIFLRV
jgi:predicted acyltransferase